MSTLEPFEQILAVDVLDDGSLEDAGETLENSTALATSPILIDVDYGIGLGVSVTLNTCGVFTVLLDHHHASYCILCGTRWSPGDLIEISLLLRHLVKISDQI